MLQFSELSQRPFVLRHSAFDHEPKCFTSSQCLHGEGGRTGDMVGGRAADMWAGAPDGRQQGWWDGVANGEGASEVVGEQRHASAVSGAEGDSSRDAEGNVPVCLSRAAALDNALCTLGHTSQQFLLLPCF